MAKEKLEANTTASLAIMAANGITPPPNYGQNAGYTENCVSSYTGVEEKDTYWYHPDHLGSSSFITGLDGEVTQNIEYFPSGEVFVENHKNSYNTPYKFNGKEQDDETGYYYYGARYYNPRVSLWLNVDPLAEKYPSFSPYIYSFNNPVRFIDPDGREPYDWYQNKATGNYQWFDGSDEVAGYSHLTNVDGQSIPIVQSTSDGHPNWGVLLNPDGTVTDWINREQTSKDGRGMITPDGVHYMSGSRETRLEYEHQTLRNVADVLENTSIALELAGVTTLIPSGGAGGTLLLAGEIIGGVSTVMNVAMDFREGKTGAAIARMAIFGLTAGFGTGIKKLSTNIAEATAGTTIKTMNDKALDTARSLEVQRQRQKEADRQRLNEAIRLENSK
ncbi:RHS repeat domain-containing protein [Chryseobacterium rhizosphaerae]|uniref:RHS repeat domain-containing protein n=1 Tax=Chryseobacterium rhizosphaerae TaxID=395937 RepID=UPI0023581933|nr:RHS repeat-associated core domain-containing protein [Chryseobacterium rhizosphaerae]MDC8100603.1 hypothetical protein [Chryseobacterium rhizosphaerae]